MSMEILRAKINTIDLKILKLLNQRLQHVEKIGKIKEQGESIFYVPSREHDLLRTLVAENSGPLSKDSLKAIFREIMSASLALEHKLQIAYLGSEGAFTHRAARNRFGASVDYKPLTSIKDIFEDVAKKRCDYGVVPIENSTEGAVTHTLDMFVNYDLKICSEISVPINHHMMGKTAKVKVKTIYSNPQVFGQCRQWLLANYPDAALVDTDSTTAAAYMASQEKNAVAIASREAGEHHKLKIMHENIQDYASNVTRFLIIGQDYSSVTGEDKTSLVFSLKDESGVLVDALQSFKKFSINLSKIESRPFKQDGWKYYFFIDMDGHFEDEKVHKCLETLKKKCTFFKILGSYPKEV